MAKETRTKQSRAGSRAAPASRKKVTPRPGKKTANKTQARSRSGAAGKPAARAARKKSGSGNAARTQKEQTLTLDGVLSIADAGNLQVKLKGLLDNSGPIELDGRSVESIDTAILQLLVAFRREAITKGIDVVWKGDCEVLSRSAGLLGLSHELDLSSAG